MTPADPVQPARTINPDAGDHVVSADPVLLKAAERAVRRSWQESPYYALRYGARGRAFSASDSGWLLTLRTLPRDAAVAQVRWLGGVLASRGMPRWLLERHLDVLHEELVLAAPEDAARHAVLAHCAAALRAERDAVLDPSDFSALAAGFDARLAPQQRKRYRGFGCLLVAAVADERSGVSAVPALTAWLMEEGGFDADWRAAVQSTLDAARQAVR